MRVLGGFTIRFSEKLFQGRRETLACAAQVLRKCCELYFKLFLVELSEGDTRRGCLWGWNFGLILSKKCRARKKFKGSKKRKFLLWNQQTRIYQLECIFCGRFIFVSHVHFLLNFKSALKEQRTGKKWKLACFSLLIFQFFLVMFYWTWESICNGFVSPCQWG